MSKKVKRYKSELKNIYLLFLIWDYDIESISSIKEYLLSKKDKLISQPKVIERHFNWWYLKLYDSKNIHLLAEP